MSSQWREHTIRERRGELDELERMPSGRWRLHHIERRAERAQTLAATANEIFRREATPAHIPVAPHAALQQVAARLRQTRPAA